MKDYINIPGLSREVVNAISKVRNLVSDSESRGASDEFIFRAKIAFQAAQLILDQDDNYKLSMEEVAEVRDAIISIRKLH